MSDNKVTLDQLDNSAVEAMSSSVGDVNMLNTENKTIVGALAEIVGKKEIANAIGEPLAETDKFTEMSSEINGLLSTFKTNMMNAGVVVESGDKFKALIDKIKGLTEGEGNKGVQYAEGVIDVENITLGWDDWTTHELTYDIDFEPTILLICISKWGMSSSNKGDHILVICDKFSNSEDSATRFKVPNKTEESLYCYITNTTSTGCTLNCYLDNHSSCDNIGGFSYCAIGVGEEDTTLRDSLASILEEKGIDVNEDDDMANLITSIDQSLIKKPKLVISDTVNDISFGSVTLKLYGSRTTAPGDVGSTSVTITDIADKCECVSAKVTISHASSYNSSFVNINCTQYRDEVLIATLHNVTLCWPNHGTTVIELTDFKKGDVLVLSGNVTTYNSNTTEEFNMSVVTSLQW